MRLYFLPQKSRRKLSDFIPADLICFHVKFKTASVSSVYNSILWFISIVDHAVFAIFHIGMYFHIVVSGIPAVQFFLCRCRPQNCTIKNTAVPEAVWKPADINASSFSKGFSLPSVLPGLSGPGPLVSGSAKMFFLTFTEINLSTAVSQDKMIPVLFPVVFVCIKIKASLFFYPQHIIQLKIFSLPLMGCRFSYSDESAAIVDKFLSPQ